MSIEDGDLRDELADLPWHEGHEGKFGHVYDSEHFERMYDFIKERERKARLDEVWDFPGRIYSGHKIPTEGWLVIGNAKDMRIAELEGTLYMCNPKGDGYEKE